MPESETETDERPDYTDQLVLTIKNGHVDSATNLGVAPNETGRYVSYFETVLGEQMIFVREKDASTGTLWMGDAEWEPLEVRRHTPEEVDARILQTVREDGKEREPDKEDWLFRTVRGKANELIEDVLLEGAELRWLRLCWTASSGMQGEEDVDWAAIGRRYAEDNFSSAFTEHPNSSHYKTMMQTWYLALGLHCGELGLTMQQMEPVVIGAMNRNAELVREATKKG
jgi:hypothetical protein